MNNSYLDQLSPVEVFQLLAKAAEQYRGQHLDRVRIVFTGVEPFKFVDLEVPDPYGNKKWETETEPEVFKTLIEAFKEMTGRRERNTSPGGAAKPLLEGIAWLLLKSANEADENIAGTKGGQYLVVTRAMEEKTAEELFRNLGFHATSMRVGSFEAGTSTGGSRYLFHIKDDPRRKSSFASIVAGGFLESYPSRVLRGYEVEEQVAFLPPEVQPGEKKLSCFCRLVEAAPVLFGGKEGKRSVGMTAAAVEWPGVKAGLEGGAAPAGENELEFLYLGEMRFFRQEWFTRRKVEQVRFEYRPLKESRAGIEGLAEAIQKAGTQVGYRLELRATKFLEKNQLERLLDQKARIEHNIAYLQGLTAPQPVLMRFSPKQLPALAAQIRSFPMHVLHDGRLKYGYQALDHEPAGYHYLFIDLREAGRSEMDPLHLWQEMEVEVPAVRFRLDPFWVRHYYEAGGESMVFVPEGSALFPPIHDWERGNMDRFLRETLEYWFRDRLRGQTLPARPIYIFDGQPGPGMTIHISVLDQERLEPLSMRLGWINDNLVIHRTLEKEKLMQEMARDITWGELAQGIKANTEKIRREFTEAAMAASQHMAQTTGEMTGVLNIEIDRVVRETFRIAQRIKRMTQRIKEWEGVLEDMEEMLQELRKQKQETLAQKAAAKNEFWRMEQEIQREIEASDRRRKEVEDKVSEEIQRLQVAVRGLKRRLKSVRL